MSSFPDTNFISTKEASRLFGYTPDYLAKLAREKKITRIRVGRSWLINRSSLERFLALQGEHKKELARTAARAREHEYREARSVPVRLSRIVERVTPSVVDAQSKLLFVLKHVSTMAAAVLIAGTAAYASTSGGMSQAFSVARTVVDDAAEGFALLTHDIAHEAFARVADARAYQVTYPARTLAGINAFVVSESASRFTSLPTQFAYFGAYTSDAKVIARVPAASRNILSTKDLLAGITHVVSEPKDTAVAVGGGITHAAWNVYRAIGVHTYTGIAAAISGYENLIAHAGEVTVSLALGTRDYAPQAPLVIGGTFLSVFDTVHAHAARIVAAYENAVYAYVVTVPRAPQHAVSFTYALGDTAARIAGNTPFAAATFGKHLSTAWAEQSLALVDAVTATEQGIGETLFAANTYALSGMETGAHGAYNVSVASLDVLSYGLRAGSIALVDGMASVEAGTEHAVRVAFGSVRALPSVASIENTLLGVAGKTALTFANTSDALSTRVAGTYASFTSSAANILPPLPTTPAFTLPERTALATYRTINGLFSRAGNALAFLFAPKAQIVAVKQPIHEPVKTVIAPATTDEVPVEIATKPETVVEHVRQTYAPQTIVQGLLRADVENMLVAWRADLFGDILDTIYPFDYKGIAISKGSFSHGRITDSTIEDSTITGSTFEGPEVTTDLLTVHGNTVIDGDLDVGGSMNFGAISVSGPVEAEYFTATSTTVASTFAYASTTMLTAETASTTDLYVSSLTDGRVPFATTAGRLRDAADLTFDVGLNRLTVPYASTTMLTASSSAYLATNDGAVGIGTESPAAKLQVNGLVRIQGAEDAGILAFGDAGSGAPYYNTGIFRGGMAVLTGGNYLNFGSWGGITFNTGNDSFGNQTTRMVIADGTGFVGIGTTSPTYTLSVEGTSSLGNQAIAGFFTATSSTASHFPYASTTMLTAQTASTTNLIVSGQARFDSLTPSRLLSLDGSGIASAVSALTSWITGTANQITVTDDGDGTATLSLGNQLSFTNATSTNFFASQLSANTFAAGQTGTTTIASTGALTTPALTVSNLTAGRIPYITTGGAITDASTLTFNASTNTLTTTNASTTNISATGTLGVSGLSTLAGGFVAQASSTVGGDFTATGDVVIGGALTVNGSLTSSITTGQIQFLATPQGTGINQGSVYINPASAGTNNVLLGVAVNGSERVRIDAEGDIQIVGLFNSTNAVGTNELAGNLSVLGNTTIGNASSDTLTVAAGIASNLVPDADLTRDLGSALLRWGNIYTGNLVVDTLVAGGTASSTFVINTANATADTEDSSLQFSRGTQTPNAILKWDSVAKRFDFNDFPVRVQNSLLVTGTASSTFSGPVWLTATPLGTGLTQAGLFINPASASTNYNLFAIGVAGVERFRVDAEGDTTIQGSLGVENEVYDVSSDTLTVNDKLRIQGNEIADSSGTTRITLGSTNTLTGNVNVTGTANVATLTASRLVATDGSKNLVSTITAANLLSSVTGTTGTGNLVFSDSPTFTGNTTLANATSTDLFASTLTANTFAAGQTGTTTIASTGALTTPTLTVSNLTAGRIPYITTGGAVTDSSNLTFNATTNNLAVPYASTTAISATGSAYLATAGGTVSVGTTTSAATLSVQGSQQVFGSSGALAFEITGDGSFSSRNPNGQPLFVAGADGDYAFNMADDFGAGPDGATLFNITRNGEFRFNTPTDPGDGSITENTSVIITDSGAVGIATDAPTQVLDVNGIGRFRGLPSGPFFTFDESTTDAGVYVGKFNSTPRVGLFNGDPGANWQIDNSNGTFRIFLPLDLQLSLSTTTGLSLPNATSGVIRASGTGTSYFMSSAFGIGTTTPAARLGVDGSGYFSGNVTAQSLIATSSISTPSLAVSGLTASRLVATDGSKNLVSTITAANLLSSVTGTTGTGNLVFSTSPTFTGTPILPSTYTIGANSFIRSGAHDLTLTTTGTTNVTLPTSGTLYGTAASSITSAQLAASLSDETGSGLAVFATSPQFTTSLTTDSTSFDLFNTTATTLNIGGAATTLALGATTGTLTLNNPTIVGSQTAQNLFNTVATTLNIGGAATSLNLGATTGTATIANPTVALSGATGVLNFSSATGVKTIQTGGTTNLNLAPGGNVGIASSTPTYKLSVEGTSSLGNQAIAGFFTATSTTASSTFAGSVGIGTATTRRALDIRSTGNAITGSTNVDVSELLLSLTNTGATNLQGTGIGFAVSSDSTNIGAAIVHQRIGSQSYGGLHFATKASGAGADTDIPIRFSIDSTGFIGIGTTSPMAKLTVSETSGANDAQLVIYDTTNNRYLSLSHGNTVANINAVGSDALRFSVGATTDGVSFMSDGTVGIGTSTPAAKLGVYGSGYFAGNVTAQSLIATSTISTPSLTVSGLTSGRVPFITTGGLFTDSTNFTFDSSASRLTVSFASTTALSASGNITAGTLNVTGQTTLATSLSGLAQLTSGAVSAITGTAGQFPYYSGTNTVSATSTIFLSTTGNVGIGTTSPQGRFQVELPAYTSHDTDAQQVIFSNATNANAGLRFGFNKSTMKGYINVLNPGVAWGDLYLQDAGRVGIGVGSINNNLDVGGSVSIGFGSSFFPSPAAPSQGLLVSGQVGIGTTEPTSMLTVNGSLSVMDNGGSGLDVFRVEGDGTFRTYNPSSNNLLTEFNYDGHVAFHADNDFGNGVQNASTFDVSTVGDLSAYYLYDTGSGDVTQVRTLYAYYDTGLNSSMLTVGDGGAGTINLYGSTIRDAGNNLEFGNGASLIHFYSDNFTSEGARIDSSGGGNSFFNAFGGNVGIGTDSPSSKLHVTGGTNSNPTLTIGTANGSTGTSTIQFSSGISGNNNSQLLQYVKTASIDRLQWVDGSGLPQMVLVNGGNVGIGTTTPGSPLTVAGTGSVLQVGNQTNADKYLRVNYAGGGFYMGTNGTEAYLLTDTAVPINFYTNNAERMRITSAGNVGIGTTNPGAPLQIGDAGNATAALLYGKLTVETKSGQVAQYRSLYQGSSIEWGFGMGNSSDFSFWVNDGGWSDAMTITSSGRVGIGSSPDTSLAKFVTEGSVGGTAAVFGDGGAGVSLFADWPGIGFNSYVDGGYKAIATGYGGSIYLSQGDGAMVFNTASTSVTGKGTTQTLYERMRIATNGNIAVGGSGDPGDYTLNLYPYPTTPSSGVLSARSGYTSYASDGLFGGTALPSRIVTPSNINEIRFGYLDGGNGEYVPRIGFYQATSGTVTAANNSIGSLINGDFSIGVGTSNTERLRIQASTGNVGIGATPVAKLHVKGAGFALPATSGTTPSNGILARFNDSSDATLDIGGAAGLGTWLQSTFISDLGSNLPLLLNPNGGNVGVGTTTPTYKFEVLDSAGGAVGVTTSSGGGALRFSTFHQPLTSSLAPFIRGQSYNSGSGYLEFFAQGSNVMTVGYQGNRVGINDDAPGANFSLVGNAQIGYSSGQTAPANGLLVAGSVGIGTSTPDSMLTVNGGTAMTGGWNRTAVLRADFPVLGFESAYSGTSKYAGIGYDRTSDGLAFFVNGSSNNITNLSNAIEAMNISNSGYVGIGTSAPSEKLTLIGGSFFQAGGSATASIAPTIVDSVELGSDINDIAVAGRYVYVGDADNNLRIYDASNPADIYEVSNTSINNGGTGSIQSMSVTGGYAYAATNETCGYVFKILSIANPSSVSEVGGDLSGCSNASANATYISGRYAYTVDTGSALTITDIANPTAPGTVGSFGLSNNLMDIYVSGKYAYIVDDAENLGIYDVSDKTSVTNVNNVGIDGVGTSVYVSGRYAYIGTDGSSGDGFQIFDISDPSSISSVGGALNSLGVTALYVSGRYAYVTVDDGTFRIFDVANPASLVQIASVAVAHPTSVYVSGRYAYVGTENNGGGSELFVYDITGTESQSVLAHSLEAGNAEIRNNLSAEGEVSVGGGLNVGGSGWFGGSLSVWNGVSAYDFENISMRDAKKDIVYLESEDQEAILTRLMSMNAATYRYKTELETDPLRLGFIVEDLETIAPEVISTNGKGVDLYKLATFTLTGVQALVGKFDTLTLRVNSLEARIAALESGAVSAATGTDIFSTTTLKSALAEFGIVIQNGIARFQTLVFRELVASKDEDGTSSAGSISILSGNKVVEVQNALVRPTTKVFVTFNGPVNGSWWVSNKQDGSFRVTLENEQNDDVSFDYFLVQTENQLAAPIQATGGNQGGQPPPPVPPPTPSDEGGAGDDVPVGTLPSIELNGNAAVEVSVGGSWSDPGAVANDAEDGDLTNAIVVTGSVDTATPGLYTITYSVTDSSGNTGNVSRIVSVVEESAPSAGGGTDAPTEGNPDTGGDAPSDSGDSSAPSGNDTGGSSDTGSGAAGEGGAE